ncbi:hypothetical protein G7046_g7008 [Stylonectria norvegica]|nr:hypothetical protein G7046_g7008 [Stylonectria norvegica]
MASRTPAEYSEATWSAAGKAYRPRVTIAYLASRASPQSPPPVHGGPQRHRTAPATPKDEIHSGQGGPAIGSRPKGRLRWLPRPGAMGPISAAGPETGGPDGQQASRRQVNRPSPSTFAIIVHRPSSITHHPSPYGRRPHRSIAPTPPRSLFSRNTHPHQLSAWKQQQAAPDEAGSRDPRRRARAHPSPTSLSCQPPRPSSEKEEVDQKFRRQPLPLAPPPMLTQPSRHSSPDFTRSCICCWQIRLDRAVPIDILAASRRRDPLLHSTTPGARPIAI